MRLAFVVVLALVTPVYAGVAKRGVPVGKDGVIAKKGKILARSRQSGSL